MTSTLKRALTTIVHDEPRAAEIIRAALYCWLAAHNVHPLASEMADFIQQEIK